MRTISLITLVTMLLSGCNALYFYDTEKISLTLEGRPDSSQPIQGSLGLKQRTAIIVPPKEKGKDNLTAVKEENKKDGADALSIISSFRFGKVPGTLFNLGAVTIQTALVTGDTAKSLSDEQAKALSAALTGGLDIPDSEVAVVNKKIEQLKNSGNLQQAKDFFKAVDCKAITVEKKEEYSRLVSDDYKENMCIAFKNQLEKAP
jgi:hypothetical protein